MSFIAVTYGYNQFSIFNIRTSTQTLIDNIKSVCLTQIVSSLNMRDSSLQKEIDASQTEEENIKKLIKTTEQDLKVEEDKELEERKKQEELEKKEAKNSKSQKKGGKAPPPKKSKKVENETENKVILGIRDQLSKLQNDLQNLTNNRTDTFDDFFNILDFQILFINQISQTFRGIKEDVGYKEKIINNLIKINKDMCEKMILNYIDKLTLHYFFVLQ